MADPEQLYQEVLSEEQGKGVSSVVAEGRAKAARARAEAGSPHPKEPKWWPGAQPHLEGGNGAAPAEADEAAEEEPAEEAVEEEPAEAAAQDQEPAEAPAAPEAPAATEEQQAPQVPQEQTAPPPEPVQPAAATAPAAAEAKPGGVSHGTTTGTRLRPEDAVTTDAQFQGQQDMYRRRQLIDELVGTGVPAAAAADTGERRSPLLALMYLLIPLVAIAFVLSQNGTAGGGGEGENGGGGGGGDNAATTVVAAGVAFDTDHLELPAGEETTITLDNQDTVAHNLSIYTDDSADESLFQGANIEGGSSTDYDVDALEAGEYFFRCDLHPTAMVGDVTVQ